VVSARRQTLGPALAAILATSLACGGDEPAPSAVAPASGPSSGPSSAESSGTAPSGPAATGTLGPDDVASIDGETTLGWADLDRYLGTVYARLPEGDDALQQLVTEAVIDAAAAAAGVTAADDEIAALEARLESQARQASGGQLGLQESLGAGVTSQDLRAALRLQVLHEGIVRHEQGLPPGTPVDPTALKAWIDAHLPGSALEQPPLDDPLAARWPGGELSKAQVGRRLRSLLPPEDVSGVLTEMIGVILVRREAARLDISLTPAEATKEVLERNTLLQARAGSETLTYDQFVETVQKRSLREMLQSDQFAAEVLLRLITERAWTEGSARAEWEAHPERFPPPAEPAIDVIGAAATPPVNAAPEPVDWEHVRMGVWRALRQDSYARLFRQSTIVRRI
jgi:hypothetical protein